MKTHLLAVAAFCLAAVGLAYEPPANTNSFTRAGVTYAQRGGLGNSSYVVTNVTQTSAPKVLPRYLHFIQLDSTYPDDAEWYYDQMGGGTAFGCSAVRRGATVYRNYDWTFDFSPEWVVAVSATAGRFASVGVASVGDKLTEDMVESGARSRYFKCLAGATLDGINENGVMAEINVNSGPISGWNVNGDIHVLGAVRWVLDNGTNAAQAAAHLAAHVRRPSGMNFHYLVADRAQTFIVENGAAHEVTNGVPVLTNFQLYPQIRGDGWERFNLLKGGHDITECWFTRAYSRATRPAWMSEFGNMNEYQAALSAWNDGRGKEAHRGEKFNGKSWWQSVHTSVYDLEKLTLKIAVQETDDWYLFACPSVGKVKSVNGKTGEVELNAEDIGAVERNDDYFNLYGGEGGFYFDAWDGDYASGVGMYADSGYAELYVWDEKNGLDIYPDRFDTSNGTLLFPTNRGTQTFLTDKNIGQYGLPNDFEELIQNRAFTNAVQAVECDPFFVPWCWATSVWLGYASQAADYALALGFNPVASGYGSIAVGQQARATQQFAQAVGVEAKAQGVRSLAVGATSRATAANASAVGYNAQAEGQEAVALGHMAVATGDKSVAVGNTVIAEHDNAVIIGTTTAPKTDHGTNTLNFVATDNPSRIFFNDKTFKQLVEQTSPPVELPEKWAFANVTNESGSISAGGRLSIGKIFPDVGYDIYGVDVSNGDYRVSLSTDGLPPLGPHSYNPYGGLCVYDKYMGWADFSYNAIHFQPFDVDELFYLDFPRRSGTIAVEGWYSLSRAFADATTNQTADCEGIATNICKLIAPHVEAVNPIAEFYDPVLKCTWRLDAVDFDLKLGPTTNIDTTAFNQVNSVLTDTVTHDKTKVIVTDGEMKFYKNN